MGIKRSRIAQQKINNTNRNHPIVLTEVAKAILVGTLLGDSSITKYKRNCESSKILNSSITCGHSYKQREYALYIKTLLEKEGIKINYTESSTLYKHIIQGKECTCNGRCDIRTSKNVTFNYWRDLWYLNGKKVLPEWVLNYITPLSIAIWFMDDGTKNNCSYYLHTESFTIEEVESLRHLLYDRFNIETSMHRMGNKPVIYIKASSRKKFTDLVKPYICESMRYKLIE